MLAEKRNRVNTNRSRSGLFALAALLLVLLVIPFNSNSHPAHAKPVKYPYVVGFERFYTNLDTAEHLAAGGMVLLNELNCVACHKPPEKLKDRLTGRTGSRLDGVADRFDHLDLELMIRNPRIVKTDTIMPSFFSGPDRDPEEIQALKHYLSTLKLATPLPKYPEGDIDKGRLLYHKIGCVACHAPEMDWRPPWLAENVEMHGASLPSVPMNLSDRYPRDVLIDLIKRPNHYRPAGRMPEFVLTDQEAVDIGTYLNSTPKPELPENLKKAMAEESGDFVLNPDLAQQGQKLFASKNCVACHDGVVDAKPILSKRLVELTTEKQTGCLSARPQGKGTPAYGLDELQKRAIIEALKRLDIESPSSKRAEVDWTFSTRNCYACHERNSKGGPESAREVFFTVNNPDAVPLGRWATHPPILDHVGDKLASKAWDAALFGDQQNSPLRPYMTARMPVYRHQDLAETFEKIIELDAQVKKSKDFALKSGDPERGKQLLGSTGLNCVACHGLGGLSAADTVSMNLDKVTERLSPEYFASFVRNPQEFYFDIPMPSYQLDDQAVSDIWSYLERIDSIDLPTGLLQPDITELTPVNRPIIIRVALADYSSDAILIGFPSGIHFAFDVASSRWIGYWKGKFIDPKEDWQSDEIVPLKPLGKWQAIDLSNELGDAAFLGYRILADGHPYLHIKMQGLETFWFVKDSGLITIQSKTGETIRELNLLSQ